MSKRLGKVGGIYQMGTRAPMEVTVIAFSADGSWVQVERSGIPSGPHRWWLSVEAFERAVRLSPYREGVR